MTIKIFNSLDLEWFLGMSQVRQFPLNDGRTRAFIMYVHDCAIVQMALEENPQ